MIVVALAGGEAGSGVKAGISEAYVVLISRAVSSSALTAARAVAAATASSLVALLCWIATGKIAAIMMKPIPSTTTANITSAKEKARRRKDEGGRMNDELARTELTGASFIVLTSSFIVFTVILLESACRCSG